MDALATEPQFLAHLAPLWRALPHHGRFYVDAPLLDKARELGVDAEPIDAAAVRASSRAPSAAPSTGPQCLVASYGDIKVARRMGYRDFAFLEHGCGQSYGNRHGSYAGGTDRGDCSLILVPNEYSAAIWRSAYPDARVRVIGSTRVKYLPEREDGPLTLAVSFHWPAMVHPYAGTAFGDFHDILPRLAETYNVIGHAHPKGDWPQRMERAYRKAGIGFVSDLDEVCRRADLYIADNTSSLFEFAATGRPVVVLNARHWDRTLHLGLRFWDAAEVGPNVWPVIRRGRLDPDATWRELWGAIESQLTNPDDEARERALGFVFAGYDGDELGARAVTEWAGPSWGQQIAKAWVAGMEAVLR
jgi:hypothetical protein